MGHRLVVKALRLCTSITDTLDRFQIVLDTPMRLSLQKLIANIFRSYKSFRMSSTPNGCGISTGHQNTGRSRPERGCERVQLESGSESSLAKKDRNLLAPTPQSFDAQSELSEIEARRSAALECQHEAAAMRASQEEQAKIDEENLGMEMADVSLDDDVEKESEIEKKDEESSNFGHLNARERARSPSPFHGVLKLGHMNGKASHTFLEDYCRHRSEFRDPAIEEQEKDDEYDMLMHSDVWSDTDAATRSRAHRSRFPPPLRNIQTETQEDNRPTSLSFEDFETLHLPSNPSCPPTPDADRWDGWFLSDTPQETYAFENDYPSAAPLLRKIIALPRNKKVELMTAAAAGTWKELASGLDKTIRLGRFVVDGVALNTRDLKEIAEDRVLDWAPGLFEAMWTMATGPFLPGLSDFRV